MAEFWELPIYDENDYFTDNAINRYSINSFMLKRRDLYVEDGKLAFYVQQDKPTDPNQLKIAQS